MRSTLPTDGHRSSIRRTHLRSSPGDRRAQRADLAQNFGTTVPSALSIAGPYDRRQPAAAVDSVDHIDGWQRADCGLTIAEIGPHNRADHAFARLDAGIMSPSAR